MRRFVICLLAFVSGIHAESNAPMNYGTSTHAVKKPPVSPVATWDYDFTGLDVRGLGFTIPLSVGNLTASSTAGMSVSGGAGAVIGTGAVISQHVADATHNGYLSATDWVTFNAGAAGGTVTSFSAGNLSPLFTTSVANASTTPALAFSLSNAAAHTFFANNTGSTGAPSFTSFTAGTNYEVPLTFSQSVARGIGTDTVTLTNDTATPGNSKYYGTNSGGTRGFFDLPSGVHKITFVVDGSGGVLQTGTKNFGKILEGGTLQGWLLVGQPSGSVTVDIFRAADGAGLPVSSIIGGGGTKPVLSSNVENSSISFTGWTSTTLTAKDNLAISLSGVTTTTYCALTLYYQ